MVCGDKRDCRTKQDIIRSVSAAEDLAQRQGGSFAVPFRAAPHPCPCRAQPEWKGRGCDRWGPALLILRPLEELTGGGGWGEFLAGLPQGSSGRDRPLGRCDSEMVVFPWSGLSAFPMKRSTCQ